MGLWEGQTEQRKAHEECWPENSFQGHLFCFTEERRILNLGVDSVTLRGGQSEEFQGAEGNRGTWREGKWGHAGWASDSHGWRTRTVTEGDGDEPGPCRRCWKVHKVPLSRQKARIVAQESGVGWKGYSQIILGGCFAIKGSGPGI